MSSAIDIASALLARRGRMDGWKLQKLLYYCQAWHLVWQDKPIFPEQVAAWKDGPVCPDVWQLHRGWRDVDRIPGGDSSRLSLEEWVTVDAVLDRYGHLSGAELRALTHSEAPWLEARHGLAASDRGNEEITVRAIVIYHKQAYFDDHKASLDAAVDEVMAWGGLDAAVQAARSRGGTPISSVDLRDLAASLMNAA